MTVYNYYDRRVVFEGTREECRNWIMDQAFKTADGRRIFRRWNEDGWFVYDVSWLYCTAEDIFDK